MPLPCSSASFRCGCLSSFQTSLSNPEPRQKVPWHPLLSGAACHPGMLEAYDREEREQPGARSLCPLEAIQCYLNALRLAGQALPRSTNGQPSKLAIAKACGIHRNVLYNRPELMALLESHPL